MKTNSRTVSALVWAVPILWQVCLKLAEWLVLRWAKKLGAGIKSVFKSPDRLDS